jgi:hypothetical protein
MGKAHLAYVDTVSTSAVGSRSWLLINLLNLHKILFLNSIYSKLITT